MDFRLTYSGPLYTTQNDVDVPRRAPHVHSIRCVFHEQLKTLWRQHPTLNALATSSVDAVTKIPRAGFEWVPLVTRANGLICKLDILILRSGPPGRVIADIDNRLKTLFDALRMGHNPDELGAKTRETQINPNDGETPFYVLLENDDLITHVSVTTDMLLQPVKDVPRDNAVRLVIGVTIRPYHTHVDNADYL